MKLKILVIIIIIALVNIMFCNINIVQAEGVSDAITAGDSFIQAGKNQNIGIDYDELEDTSKIIYNILLTLGICIAVVISSVLGIKFMLGSVEEKAQIKDALIPFIIGCVVIFSAFAIWSFFINMGNNL